ncbi:hypothetical protein [Stenotrophomonas sp.]|uniref:hypothetical protein n=1 Tax=Stenotrophomonas sp. TaxID=69392 RepID=UPI0028A8173C|nr:hypothetical protein [Stenotrophomonas sp.]
MGGVSLIGMIGLVFGVVLAILWILVPFAIFGIKPLLQGILAELRRANAIAEGRAAPALGPVSPAEGDEPQGTLATIRAAVRQADRP